MNRVQQTELDVIYDSAPVGLCLIGTDLRFHRINAAMAEINGLSVQEHLGRTVEEVVPDLLAVAVSTMAAMVESGEPVGPFEVTGRTAAKPGITRYWSETWSPIRDSSGQIIAASIVAIEVTDQKRAENEKDQALKEVQQRLAQQAALAEIGYEALTSLNLSDVLDRSVRAAVDVLQVPLAKVLRFSATADHLDLVAGIGWKEGLVGTASVGIDQESQAGYTLLSASPVVVDDLLTEQRFSGPPLLREHGVRSGMSVTIPGDGVRPFGVFGVHTTDLRAFTSADVDFLVSLVAIVANAARREAIEKQRTLLVREMAHRAGNMLQLVSSIATQTFKNDDVHAARQKFGERLSALARANHSIARQGWQEARVREVIEQTLAPFSERFQMEGRDVMLPPELCFDLGLVLHELATNSAKYGSLGESEGKVVIAWTVVNNEPGRRQFQLTWSDPARPKSNAPEHSKGQGFGTKLISLLVESKWAGGVSRDTEWGYRTKLWVPLPN